MKKYNVIENQINKLKQKGLIFKNEESAKEILLKENYYFLTDGYEDIFLNLKNSNKKFEDETYFEELYAIYNFDRELKNLIMDYISIVETNLKAFIAYEFTEKYGENDLLDINYLNDTPQVRKRLDKLKNQINVNLEKASCSNAELRNYLKENKYLKPLIYVKHFMFRNIISFISLLKEEDKETIAEHFNVDISSLEKNLLMLNLSRNICAHGGILLNFRFGYKTLYSVVKTLKKYLDEESFYNMFIRIENLLVYVKNEVDDLSYNNLLKTMGFPQNYKSVFFIESKNDNILESNLKHIDKENIGLSNEILVLAEKIACNTHEIWAKERKNEGWKYGTVRDDILKTTPCLVPFNELPISEKEADRNSAIETLKLIPKLGFKIIKDNK